MMAATAILPLEVPGAILQHLAEKSRLHFDYEIISVTRRIVIIGVEMAGRADWEAR